MSAYDKLFRDLSGRHPSLAVRARDVLRRWELVSEGVSGSPPALATPPGRRQRQVCPSCRGQDSSRCPRCRGRGDVVATTRHKSTVPHHESKPPWRDGQPEFTYWLTEFATAPNLIALEDRVTEAEEEYERYTGHTGAGQRAAAEAQRAFGQDGAAMEEVQAQRILSRYQGKTAAEAARLEGDSRYAPWIEKVRRLNGYDDTGHKRPEWERWNRSTRVQELRALRQRGLSQREAADQLRIPRSTLQNYWEEARP